MSEFAEQITVQALHEKLKTAMEIADSATIIVMEREKQIKDLQQQLELSEARVGRLTNYLRDSWRGNYTFELKRILNETPAQGLAEIKAAAVLQYGQELYANGEDAMTPEEYANTLKDTTNG